MPQSALAPGSVTEAAERPALFISHAAPEDNAFTLWLGAKLSAIDLSRDDKAHRFVVTWNAFLDGNRLAYLSLILAIGVDGLVFMSGL